MDLYNLRYEQPFNLIDIMIDVSGFYPNLLTINEINKYL